MPAARILWDWGSAYDFFVSLGVLHQPTAFGVRASWAAGVRARIPVDARETLEQSHGHGYVPFHWIYGLAQPKNGLTVLDALQQIPADQRVRVLIPEPGLPGDEARAVLEGVTARGRWEEADRASLQAIAQRARESEEEGKVPSSEDLVNLLDAWATPEAFGRRYLEALRSYYQAFFAEEEKRILPALKQALEHAQDLATRLELPHLLEKLSQGLQFEAPLESEEVVLAPSYWTTPLVYFGKISPQREILLFGARPPDASLVPGETVPDTLIQALKALSDPTRLRILHDLAQEPQSPADLARRLRLRLPTVTHHLKKLRLAGLVRLALGEGKTTRRYAARTEALEGTWNSLQRYLQEPDLHTGPKESEG